MQPIKSLEFPAVFFFCIFNINIAFKKNKQQKNGVIWYSDFMHM